ncbi:unnamed protein product, partial [Brenthis ino]
MLNVKSLIFTVSHDLLPHELDITSFNKFKVAYMNIKDTLNLINSIYGIQLTCMLISASALFIATFYVIASTGIEGYITWLDTMPKVFIILVTLIAIFILSQSAQTVQNSVESLRRSLGTLIINLAPDNENFKTIKYFLRLISNQPLIIRAVGYVNVDMSLVPKMVMLVISYTVIALQFNNVV